MFDRIAEGRWWDEGVTLVSGCTQCSPGCDHCWALATERRWNVDPVDGVSFHDERLKRLRNRGRPRAFAIWNDLFHPEVTQWQQHEAWAAMLSAPQHRFLVLTKRPAEMARVLQGKCATHRMDLSEPKPHIWVGTTVCNQAEADEKIPHLLRVPAAVRFLSIEPILGPVDIVHALYRAERLPESEGWGIDWVIAGGETGPGARPAHPDWFRSLRDQCQLAGVPFFLKGVTARRDRDLDGRTWEQMPAGAGEVVSV